MIWVEPVVPTAKTVDILETINKAKKSISDFQLYLDHEMGVLARDDKKRERTVGRRESSTYNMG